VTQIKGDWQFLMDETVPSCRSLDQPYIGADRNSFQYYLIDGFIVSGNLRVEALETQDLDFVASDHNPVLLRLTLED
jgi:endonuclease/exonuclease/phosphatase family metal-dependent hydrolase